MALKITEQIMNGLEIALDMIWVALHGEENLTVEQIEKEVDLLYPIFVSKKFFDNTRTEQEIKQILVRNTEERMSTWITGDAVVLDNNEDTHNVWLESRKGSIEWNFWNRYVDYLKLMKRWNNDSIEGLDKVSDLVLGRLEDPTSSGPWDRRGMIVGDVQSGKTANYIGLINKAIDSGYKLIIVLAGMHNSLRSQTQMRVNEGVLGFDAPPDAIFNRAKPKKKTGVGNLPNFKEHGAATLTSSEENGDFSIRIANQVMVYPGQLILVLVVKKNASVLKNLKDWVATPWAKETVKGKYIENVPLLVIDDEADNASINTLDIYDKNGNVDPDCDITKINALIRQILDMFEKKAYVGYTATPFANIFIDPSSESERFGEDLFPRSFIISLPVPSDYIGPDKIFGLGENTELGIEQNTELPLVKTISDYKTSIPDNHKKDLVIKELPKSLKKAIRFFILSTAARAARGEEHAHNSMLVHVTRFVDVQNKLRDLIYTELREIQQRIHHGEGKYPEKIMDELRDIWENQFMGVTETLQRKDIDSRIRSLKWEEIQQYIDPAAMKIQIIVANGSSKDVLEYRNYEKEGLCAIIIGGDKLSRGLTLEGLTISYYLRASRMYDTLMQMGRWFGYRPGYLDLCRIFTSSDLKGWYSHIAIATKELRQEIIYMSDRGMTPMQYGLRVRTHPDQLIVTSLNKMRAGWEVKISYSGTISESVVFHNKSKLIEENNSTCNLFVNSLKNPIKSEGNKKYYRWNDISGEEIVDLFGKLHTHEDSFKADSVLIRRYISGCLKKKELKKWTVILLSGGDGDLWKVGNFSVNCMRRTQLNSGELNANKITIKRLVSPLDEWLDMDPDTQKEILRKTREEYIGKKSKMPNPNAKEPAGPVIRQMRQKENGLLLLYPLEIEGDGNLKSVTQTIGFAVSFPVSNTAEEVTYIGNKVYFDTEIRQ
jgi:hypothetical protein